MRFNTDVYYVKPERIFGGYTLACWKLWFIEDSDIKDRQHIIECHTFPAKPTKKQIRKLRRQFRKENQNSLAEFFAEEGTAAMYW